MTTASMFITAPAVTRNRRIAAAPVRLPVPNLVGGLQPAAVSTLLETVSFGVAGLWVSVLVCSVLAGAF